MEQYRSLGSDNPATSGHFLGSFVLSPKDPTASGVSYFLVIDGQQRLTTLMLLLCALRDRASEHDEQSVARYDENYLINKFHEGEARLRLLPTEEDRHAFAVGDPRAGQRSRRRSRHGPTASSPSG